MIVKKLHIRHWTVLFLFCFDARNSEDIEDALIWADAPNSIIESVMNTVFAERPNEGFCYSAPSIRRSVVAIGRTSSGPEFLNTTIHEIMHLSQHIAAEDGIEPLSEEIAYLIGDITRDVSHIVCELSCPHCNSQRD